jgi:hypothetical protein
MERSVELLESKMGPEHPILLSGLNNLATVYAVTRRRDEADATFQMELVVAQKYVGANHPMYGAVLSNYAAFLRANGRKAEAKALAAQSKEVLRDSAHRNGLGMTVDTSGLRHQ